MISGVKYRDPLQASEMTELRWIFRSTRLIARELGLPSYMCLSPPTIRRTRCVSVLDSLMSQRKKWYRLFLPLGKACFETKNMVSVPSTCLEERRDLPPPCDRRKNSLAVEISQGSFSGPDRRVWREDLAPVMVSITAAAVATMGHG